MDRASDPVAYRLAKTLLSRPLRRFYDIEVEGDARLPDGPVVLAANHRSFMDSIFLAVVVDRPVSFLAKAEYFDRRRTAWIFRSTGQIPLWRGDPGRAPRGRRRRHRLARARRAQRRLPVGLARGHPAGTRSRDGMLHRGTLGAARLAATSGAPILPIGLVGTDQVQAPDQRLPRTGKRVAVRFGKPVGLRPQSASSRAQLRDATDEVMADIADLCGQPYDDHYSRLPRPSKPRRLGIWPARSRVAKPARQRRTGVSSTTVMSIR